MIEDLKGKVVLITGSSTGIGAAVARAFGANQAKVAVHYNRNEGPAQQVVRDIEAVGGEAVAMQADVTSSAAIKSLIEQTVSRFGRIDVLINNAGDLVGRRPITEMTDEFFDQVAHLNMRSVLMACKEAVPFMRRQGGGNIINVTSIAARHGGGGGALLYAASKGFVSTVTRGMAKEFVADNIRVNAVSPGVIATPFHDRHTSAEQMEAFNAGIPMRRAGTPDECAGTFLYLASNQLSGYVTGQIVEVNGGQLMP